MNPQMRYTVLLVVVSAGLAMGATVLVLKAPWSKGSARPGQITLTAVEPAPSSPQVATIVPRRSTPATAAADAADQTPAAERMDPEARHPFVASRHAMAESVAARAEGGDTTVAARPVEQALRQELQRPLRFDATEFIDSDAKPAGQSPAATTTAAEGDTAASTAADTAPAAEDVQARRERLSIDYASMAREIQVMSETIERFNQRLRDVADPNVKPGQRSQQISPAPQQPAEQQPATQRPETQRQGAQHSATPQPAARDRAPATTR
jgi:hypothetical protein